ncbi:uroporphyrinogen-III C-methyltransferase [Agaribacillus aureus]
MKMKEPQLILVGAGPGDADLITLKGIGALKAADVVLYDALANKTLLDYVKPEAIKVFVGKRAGLHHYQQFTINKMIVKYAMQFGTVVRLKGGDPYVFGRGHEEAAYARRHGLKVTVVPGVSSAIAVPALQDIPLTKRGVCHSFCVVTATGKDGQLTGDIKWAATGKGTVVILMGMKKLPEIVNLFRKFRADVEPVAIIRNGTCANEAMGLGTLKNIVKVANDLSLQAPAVIVIGQVVKERAKIEGNYLWQHSMNLGESSFI